MERVDPRRAGRRHLLRLLPHSALPLVLLLTLACGGGDPPSLVLVVLDTVRADLLGAYGNERGTSPHLDALAERGVVFRNCLAASPWTGPSVASILTGRYPDEVGVRGLLSPLDPAATTLAERLREAGYRTGAVVSNEIAGAKYGYDAGYEDFHLEPYTTPDTLPNGLPIARPHFRADLVTQRALGWLESARDPFFLHVHYSDPHVPYLPPEPWRGRLAGDDLVARDKLVAGALGLRDLQPQEVEGVRHNHEAEIAFMDDQIGRLLEALPEGTVVVVVSDHGEEFLDHGGYLHGHSLYQELLHVPLIFAGPGVPSGTSIDFPVSHVDVVPTILDLLGLPVGSVTGRSLRPLFSGAGGDWDERSLLSILENGQARSCTAIRRGRWKLQRCAGDGARLFDLSADPEERHDVASRHPRVRTELLRRLENRDLALPPRRPPEREGLEEAERQRLRALGYL